MNIVVSSVPLCLSLFKGIKHFKDRAKHEPSACTILFIYGCKNSEECSRIAHSSPNHCKGIFICVSCVLQFLRSLVLQSLMSSPLYFLNKSEKRALIILVSMHEWGTLFILLKWLIQCQVEDPIVNVTLRGTIFLWKAEDSFR